MARGPAITRAEYTGAGRTGQEGGQMAGRWVDLRVAAEILGVSTEAVRKRASRGTLESRKGEDGRVYVRVDAGEDEGVTPDNNALISHLQDEVAYLRDENRRKDEIIMQQAMTMRALGSPTPETTRDEQNDGQGEPGPGPEGRDAPEPAEGNIERPRRGLWRRIFGG